MLYNLYTLLLTYFSYIKKYFQGKLESERKGNLNL